VVAGILLSQGHNLENLEAHTMVKLHPSLCVLGVIAVTAALAQQPAPLPPPIEASTAPGIGRTTTTTTSPAAATPGINDATTNRMAPAAIEPPLLPPPTNDQMIPPAPPSTTSPTTDDLPPMTAPTQLSPTASRLNEFQGDEIGLVLRTLARQAGVTVIVTDKVSTAAGPVTARIENKTPMEAIGIIVDSKGLIMDEKSGVLYIKTRKRKPRSRPTAPATPSATRRQKTSCPCCRDSCRAASLPRSMYAPIRSSIARRSRTSTRSCFPRGHRQAN
jgi:hypothetical protein